MNALYQISLQPCSAPPEDYAADSSTAATSRRATRRGGSKAKAKRDRAAERAVSSSTDDKAEQPDSPVEPPPPPPPRDEVQCPISLQLFEDPVMLAGDENIYSRSAITAWLARNNTSPLHNTEMDTQDKLRLIPCPSVCDKVERYRAAYPDED